VKVDNSAARHRDIEFLQGITVVELAGGIAGSTAASILAMYGAHVIKQIKDAELGTNTKGALATFLDRRKRLVDTSVEELLEEFPRAIVILDRMQTVPSGVPWDPTEYLAYIAERLTHQTWVTISAYGFSGSQAAWRGSDLTAAASASMLWHVREVESGRPVALPGLQACQTVGHTAALAALYGFDQSSTSERGVHVDVSAQDAALGAGSLTATIHSLMNCGGDYGDKRYGAPAGEFLCRDGAIRIHAMENHQWFGIARAMGDSDLGDRYATTDLRLEYAADINEVVGRWTASRDKSECEALLQSEGVPATVVATVEEILRSDQLNAREALEPELEGSAVYVVNPLSPQLRTTRALRTDRERPRLPALKVLEFTHVLAAPLAGALLGAMGVRVTKAEDPTKLEMYRRLPPYVDGHPGAEWSAYFAMANHSKVGRLIDYSSQKEIDGLMAENDVVLENLGQSRAERLGITPERIAELSPGTLSISSSGFGHQGPAATFRAYAGNVHARCGLEWLTREIYGTKVDNRFPFADFITSYFIATFITAWAVGDGPGAGHGGTFDVSMAEIATARLNAFLIEFQTSADDEPSSRGLIDGTFQLRDNSWIAVTVFSREQFDSFVRVLNADAVSLPGAGEWDACNDDADGLLTSLVDFFLRQSPDCARELARSGVAASPVFSPAQAVVDENLTTRQFLGRVEHPVWGQRRLFGLPWEIVGQQRPDLSPPPLATAHQVNGGT
jgi:crotonobetainyl-CoA:carnitine CoA-transferase CaiB-like acyl-CoA transferase